MIKVFAVVLIATLLSACMTDEYGHSRPMTDTEKGAIFGSLGGAVIGAAVDHKKPAKGALIGAVGGGLAGGGVGYYMDSQAKDLQKVLAPEVTAGAITIDPRADHSIKVTMTAATAFATNSYAISGGFYPTLDKISKVVNTYGKTTILIEGHTDSVGADQSNQVLSERRAKAVEDYFLAHGVVSERLDSVGRGEKEPIASNDNETGRARNRRVVLLLEPVVAN